MSIDFWSILSSVGILFFMLGVLNMTFNHDTAALKNKLLTAIGGILLVTSVGFLIYENKKQDQWLVHTISEQLSVDTSEIIVEDISEVKFFTPSKNVGLKRVFVNNKMYLVEVINNDYTDIKIIENFVKSP